MTEEPVPPLPESADGPEPPPPSDPLRRVIQIALAIYLLPAFLLVLVVGGIALVAEGIAGGLRRAASAMSSRFRR